MFVPIHMKLALKVAVLFSRSNRSLYSLVSLRPLPADYEPSMVILPGTCPLEGNIEYIRFDEFQIEDTCVSSVKT